MTSEFCPCCGRRGDHRPTDPWVLNESATRDHLRDGWALPYQWERAFTCVTEPRWRRIVKLNTATQEVPA